MVHDVGGQLGAVAPADDALLARARGFPVHFQLELVGLDEARRLGEPLAERAEEEQESMRLGLVIVQARCRPRRRAPRDGAVGEGAGAGTVFHVCAGGAGGAAARRQHACTPAS